MRRYVDWLCEQGVPVILLTYGSSEFSVLSAEENPESSPSCSRAPWPAARCS